MGRASIAFRSEADRDLTIWLSILMFAIFLPLTSYGATFVLNLFGQEVSFWTALMVTMANSTFSVAIQLIRGMYRVAKGN